MGVGVMYCIVSVVMRAYEVLPMCTIVCCVNVCEHFHFT